MALTDVLRRIRWLKFLYPAQADLQYEQGFWNTKRQRHVAYDHSAGVSNGLEVTAKGPASLVVSLAAGRAIDVSGDDSLIAAAQDLDLTSFVPGAATQTVYIVIYYSVTETDPYVVPELGTSQNRYYREAEVVRAQLAVPSGDEIELARIEIAAAAAQLTDAINSDYPGNNEIDMRYRKYSNTRGLSLQVSTGATDTPLSTVTVGETNCDFRDLADALSYVNSLTLSVIRQVAILMFEKKKGLFWQPGAVFTVPTYTHLIGMGKPALVFNGVAGTLITLNQGASIRNFHIEADHSWTKGISFAGHEAVADNVDWRHESATSVGVYAYYIEAGVKRVRISNCKLFPYSFDSTKGCYGIYVNGGSAFIVENCYLEGPSDLIGSAAGSYDGKIVNLHLKSTSAVAVDGGGRILGWNHEISNVTVYVTTGTTNGLVVIGLDGEGRHTNLANVSVTGSSANNSIYGLSLDNCHVVNPTIRYGRMQIIGSCTVSGGTVYCPSTDAVAAVVIGGVGNTVTGLKIDRGGEAQPCIQPATNAADENQITGCRCDNTGGVASIDNTVVGADDWLCVGNMVDEPTPVGNGWDIVGEKVI